MDSILCLNTFCGGLFFLIFIILWLMFRRVLSPVLSFIFKPPAKDESRLYPNTAFEWVKTLLASIFFFTLLWLSFSVIRGVATNSLADPIFFFVFILAVIVAAASLLGLGYFYRSLSYALRLDRYGITETPVLGEVFQQVGDGEYGSGSFPVLPYFYAKDFKGNIRLAYEFGEISAYEQNRLQITVTYIPELPGIHRVTKKKLSEPLGHKPAPKPADSGAAEEVIPRALAEFVKSRSGSFIIFWLRATYSFVQFVMVGDVAVLEYAIPTKQKSTPDTERARQYFSALGVAPIKEGRGAIAYRMDFPTAPRQVEKASKIALDIFVRVFGLKADTILEVERGY